MSFDETNLDFHLIPTISLENETQVLKKIESLMCEYLNNYNTTLNVFTY